MVKTCSAWKDCTGLPNVTSAVSRRWGDPRLVLGAGFAERVGLLPALMVKMASHVSARYASGAVYRLFSHISSDAALVIMPPLGR